MDHTDRLNRDSDRSYGRAYKPTRNQYLPVAAVSVALWSVVVDYDDCCYCLMAAVAPVVRVVFPDLTYFEIAFAGVVIVAVVVVVASVADVAGAVVAVVVVVVP